MIGPKDQWEVVLEKTSYSGLLELARQHLLYLSREERLNDANFARAAGKRCDLIARINKFVADPIGDTRRKMRKADAARKAARRRKREQKKGQS